VLATSWKRVTEPIRDTRGFRAAGLGEATDKEAECLKDPRIFLLCREMGKKRRVKEPLL